MTVRRAEDAGLSPVLALLFLVPGVNFALQGVAAHRRAAAGTV
ncbi:hypothetical protein [Nannocystis radixulma]|uniref:Uncharacterized protein n=1 Tax=Nannocystis radixulma TaxID=2995305 RepID=A0ABT5BMC0_9BACT|nr:hypothetical protein [Nannocystis radixulma]MDC0675309.1 hypothetical protein [Nannocystis radixulma]